MFKVIIIDDEKVVCRTIKLELEEAGYLVDCAFNGQEGIKKIIEGQYDLVFVDLILPDTDGVRVCRQIKEGKPDTIVVLISGHVNEIENNKEAFFSAGGYAKVLTKPFKENEIMDLVREMSKGRG